MKFDEFLREEYQYSPFGVDLDDWRGLTHEVLVVNDSDFFKKWLQVEKDCEDPIIMPIKPLLTISSCFGTIRRNHLCSGCLGDRL